jgi:hypothetical protein
MFSRLFLPSIFPENFHPSGSRTNTIIQPKQHRPQPAEKLPQNIGGWYKFYNENLDKVGDVSSMGEFRQKFTPEVEKNFQTWAKGFFETTIRDMKNNLPAGSKSADTVAGVFGQGSVGMLQGVFALKDGRVTDVDEILKMPFSKVAKKYLNIDFPKDYFDHFSQR